MQPVLRGLQLQNPAHALLVALLATGAGIGLLLLFILARRTMRRRYFQKRDRRVQFVRENWEAILTGAIPAQAWFFDAIDREVVQDILLGRMEAAGTNELLQLQELVRRSGLLDSSIRQVRRSRGWSRRRALLTLGRMAMPEGIPALAEALQDPQDATVIDAIRGLGQVGTPRAAAAILERTAQKPVACPPQTLQTALVNCYRAHPQELLDKTLDADEVHRPVLARVLAEVATSAISGDLLSLAADPLAEVRAAAARIITAVRPNYALNALSGLAADKEWFVRLRAVVGLGELTEPRSIPVLVKALCDSNRLVRLRAAAALVQLEGHEEHVLRLAMQTGDKYALQALVSELERSGRIPDLVNGLANDVFRPLIERALLAALQGGSMRTLTDLMLHHPDRRVRDRLARLLAGSGEAALLQQLEQVDLPLSGSRHQRLLRWLIANLREGVESMDESQPVAV